MEKYNDRNQNGRRPSKPNVIRGGYRAAFNDSDEKIVELAQRDEDAGKKRSKPDKHDESRKNAGHDDNGIHPHSDKASIRPKLPSQSRGCLLIVIIFIGVITVIILVTLNLPRFNLENVGPFKFNTDGGFKIEWPFGSDDDSGDQANPETTDPIETWESSPETTNEAASTTRLETAEQVDSTDQAFDSDPLLFDDQVSIDSGNMLSAHNAFTDAVIVFADGEIDASEILKICDDTSTYFRDIAGTLTYGADDAQDECLIALRAAAMSDQIAADAVKRYIAADTLSELENEESDYSRNKGDAEQAYIAIKTRRETYLKNAGVPTPEIDARIGG